MRILAIYTLFVVLDYYSATAQSEVTYFGSIDPHIAINIPYADRGLDIIQFGNQLIMVGGYVDALDQYNRKCDLIKVDLNDFSVQDIVRHSGPQGDLAIVEGILNIDGYLYFTGEWLDYTVLRSRFFLAKYTTDFEMVWVNYFPELDDPDFGYHGYDLCPADDGGGVLIVYVKRNHAPDAGRPATTWVLRADTAGAVVFDKLLPDTLGCSSTGGNISPAGEGQYIITTYSPDNCSRPFKEHAIIHKIDEQGDIVWTVTRKGYRLGYQRCTSAPLSGGGVAVAMTRDSLVFFDDGTWADFYYGLDGYDSGGNCVWQHDWWLRMVSYIEDLHPAANGDVLGCGYWYSLMEEPEDIRRKGWLFRFSPEGVLKWQRLYNDVPEGFAKSWDGETAMIMTDLTELDDGRIAMTGFAWDSTDYPGALDSIDANILLMVVDSMGCLIPGCEGEEQFISATDDVHVIGRVSLARLAVSPNPASGMAVVQWPGEPPQGISAYRLQAYDSAGRLIWSDAWAGQPLTIDTGAWPRGQVTLMCLHRGMPVAAARLMIIKP